MLRKLFSNLPISYTGNTQGCSTHENVCQIFHIVGDFFDVKNVFGDFL